MPRKLRPRTPRNQALGALVVTLGLGALGEGTAPATTYWVTKTADTTDGLCDSDCSLREAVRAANAHAGIDVIQLPAGSYAFTKAGRGEDAALTGDLDITEAVTIQGVSAATTVIDAKGLDRVFEVPNDVSGVTMFRDLTIRGGNPGPSVGGGVYAYSPVAMTDCVVTANVAQNGGGIYAYDSLTFEDGTIQGNLASRLNDVAHGGGVFSGSYGASIRRSTISGNRAEGALLASGGGISCFGCQELEVSDSIVELNVATVEHASAEARGGGIAVVNTGKEVHIETTTIEGNQASRGGGVWSWPNIEEAEIVIERSTLAGNVATVEGGGAMLVAYNTALPAIVRNCTFSGNRSNLGAAVYAPVDYPNDVHLSSCTISGNLNDGGQDAPFAGLVSARNSIVTGTNLQTGPVVSSYGGNLESPGNTFGFTHSTDLVNVTDPMMGPLGWNGGSTRTHALERLSPAVDAGRPANCLSVDQRGQPRPSGSNCDIGAYEVDLEMHLGTIYYELHPWPYRYIYTGCPGPIAIDSTGEVVLDFVLTASNGTALRFELAAPPRYGRASLRGNVLRFTTRTLGHDDVALAVTDGVTTNLVMLPIDLAVGCAPEPDERPAGCYVSFR